MVKIGPHHFKILIYFNTILLYFYTQNVSKIVVPTSCPNKKWSGKLTSVGLLVVACDGGGSHFNTPSGEPPPANNCTPNVRSENGSPRVLYKCCFVSCFVRVQYSVVFPSFDFFPCKRLILYLIGDFWGYIFFGGGLFHKPLPCGVRETQLSSYEQGEKFVWILSKYQIKVVRLPL